MRKPFLFFILLSLPVSANFEQEFVPLEKNRVFCEERGTFLKAISHLEGFGLSDLEFDFHAGYLNESMVLAHFGVVEDEHTLKIAENLIDIYQNMQATINYFYVARGALSAYDMSDSTCVGEKSIYTNQFQEAYDLAIDQLEDMRGNIRSLYYNTLSMLRSDYDEAARLGYDTGFFEDWIWAKFASFNDSSPDDITRALGKIEDLLFYLDTRTLAEFNDVLGWSRSIYLLPILRLHTEFARSRAEISHELKQKMDRLRTIMSAVSSEYDLILEAPSAVRMNIDSEEIERLLEDYHLAGYSMDMSRFYYDPSLEITLREDGLVVSYSLILNALERLEEDYEDFLRYRSGLENMTASLANSVAFNIQSLNRSLSEVSTGTIIARRYLYDASANLMLSGMYEDVYSRNYYLMRANESLSRVPQVVANPTLVVELDNRKFSELVSNLTAYFDFEDLMNKTRTLQYLPPELSDLYRREMKKELEFRLFGSPLLNEIKGKSEFLDTYQKLSEFMHLSSLFDFNDSSPEMHDSIQDMMEMSIFFEKNFPLRELTMKNLEAFAVLESSSYLYSSRFALLTSFLCDKKDYLIRVYPLSKVFSFDSGSFITSLWFTPLGKLCLESGKQLVFEIPSDDFYIFSNQSLNITGSSILFNKPVELDIVLNGKFSNYSFGGRATRLIGDSLWITENYTISSRFSSQDFFVRFPLEYCPERAYAVYGDNYFPLSVYCNDEKYVHGLVSDLSAGSSLISIYYKLDPFDLSYSWDHALADDIVTGYVTVRLTNTTTLPLQGSFEAPLPYHDFIEYGSRLVSFPGKTFTFTALLDPLISHAIMLVNYYQRESFAHANAVGRRIGKMIKWSRADYLLESFHGTINYAKNLMQTVTSLNATDEGRPDYVFGAYTKLASADVLMKSDRTHLDSFLVENDLYFLNLDAAYKVYDFLGPTDINHAINKYERAIERLQEYDFYSALQYIKEANSIFAEMGEAIDEEANAITSEILFEINRLNELSFLGLFDYEYYKKEFFDRMEPAHFMYGKVEEYRSLSDLYGSLKNLSFETAKYSEVYADSCSKNYSSLRNSLNLKLLDITAEVDKYRESLETDFSSDEKSLLHIIRTPNNSGILAEFDGLMSDFQDLPGSLDGLSLEAKNREYRSLQSLYASVLSFDKQFSKLKREYEVELGSSIYLMREFNSIAKGNPDRELSERLMNLERAALDSYSQGYGLKAYIFSTEVFEYTRDLAESIYPYGRIGFILLFIGAIVLLLFMWLTYKNRFLKTESSMRSRK